MATKAFTVCFSPHPEILESEDSEPVVINDESVRIIGKAVTTEEGVLMSCKIKLETQRPDGSWAKPRTAAIDSTTGVVTISM